MCVRLHIQHVMTVLFYFSNMGLRTLSLAAIFALAAISFTMAHASSQTQISLTSFGNTEIDLAWNDQDRIIKSWAGFSDFNPSDGSFTMQIVQSETGKVVADTTIQLITTSQSSAIDFNSFVMYMVSTEDICQNDEFDAETSAWQECNPLTGEYEMHVSTNDGSVVESITFTIVDSRV